MAVENGENKALIVERDEAKIRIKPSGRIISIDFREIWLYRELLFFLAWRDIKVRYQQTVLGAAWVLLQPIATTLIFTVLFGRLNMAQSLSVPYPLYAFSGFVLWTFFSSALTNSSNSLINQANLVTKVYFPRLIVPMASICASVIDLALNLFILAIVLILFGVFASWQIICAPIFLILLFTLAFAAGTLLAALNVKYRDVKNILPFILQLLLFMSPIFYGLEILPQDYRWVWRLNPLTGILNGFRASLFGTEFDIFSISFAFCFTFLLLFLAVSVFRKMEDEFADVI